MSARSALHSSGKDDWRTPRYLLDELDAEFGFLLDAAASPRAQAFPGRPFIGPQASESGSLGVCWLSFCPRFVRVGAKPPAAWLNSPYSKAAGGGEGVKAWHRKSWEESRKGLTVVVLSPSTLDRTWAGEFAALADEIRIFRHRLSFIEPETLKPARGNVVGSCLTIYRPHVPAEGWPGGPRISWIESRPPKG